MSRVPHSGDPGVVPAQTPAGTAGQGLTADEARVVAARRLLHPSATPALDRLAGLAARLLGAPSAQLSLLTDVQTIAGGSGLDPASRRTPGPLADSLCTVTASGGQPLVVADAVSDVRVNALPPVAGGSVGAYLGVPLRNQDGFVLGALCVFGPTARTWSSADVTLLADLAAATVTEMELAALAEDYEAARVRWQLAVTAGGVGTFDWDLTTGVLSWDSRLLEMFGYAADDFGRSIEAFTARLHPDDVARVTRALESSIATVGTYDAEYRVVRPDGTTRWVRARGQALGDETGRAVRVLGAAHDTTAARDDDAKVARVLESMASAFFSLDREFRFSYVNAEAERVLGRPRAELLGGSIWELFPEAVGSEFETNYRGVATTGEPATFEAYYPAPLDAWYEVRAWPDPDGVSVYFLDVTAQRRARREVEAARTTAEAAAEKLRMVVSVSEDLSSTLDVEDAVARLALHLVPALADWCLVTLVDQHGHLRDLGCHHVDPTKLGLVRAYRDARLTALSERSYLHRVWRTSRPTGVRSEATEAICAQLEPDSPARELIRQLNPASFECLPVRARGRTVGLITLFHDTPGGSSAEDLLLATEIGDRAGLALDNARLYSAQHRVAEGLQRSLLTDPVQPDHVQIVVRYRPSAQAARVGGDWYDAFLTPDGATVLVIGDVMGHDVEAAAAMSQVRSLLRGIAYTTQAPPARVLSGLDAAMQGLGVDTTATAVVARLELSGDRTLLRWSNAGHLAPLVLSPRGAVGYLEGGVAPQLLLGVDPAAQRSDAVLVLERGATVVMFTDGLIERRDRSLPEGLRLLRDRSAELAGGTLDELVDGLLELLLTGDQEDDVAIVAFHLHPLDGPRPAEAGQEDVPEDLPTVLDAQR